MSTQGEAGEAPFGRSLAASEAERTGETPQPRSRRGMGTAQGHGLGLRSRSNSSASSAQQEADLQLHRQKMHSLTRDVSSA